MTQTDIQNQIVAAANAKGVDPALALAVAKQESGFNPNARNMKSGATGLFQLMPSTAAGLGVDPNDPSQNIQGGVAYLSQMLTKYNGDQALALAAYNAGPGTVDRYGGVPPYPETQNYITRILGSISFFGAGSTTPDLSSSDDAGFSGADLSGGLTSGTNPLFLVGILIAGLAALYWFSD